MAIVADLVPFVIGVDTHARNHALAIISPLGGVVAEKPFRTNPAGLKAAIKWVAKHTGADLDALWVIEGIGSYGAHLARSVQEAGYRVVEAARMNARANNAHGKCDPVDARRIGRAVLGLDESQLRLPRQSAGPREALTLLVTAREHMTRERTAAINALTALCRKTQIGIDARRPLTPTQIAAIAGWRARPSDDLAARIARAEAIRLAKRIQALGAELKTNTSELTALLQQTEAARLLAQPGIGPVCAAICYTAWSHPGRIRNEAAFAALAGTCPIPASSGNTQRHRLNRGGDRRVNKAAHTIVLSRMATDPKTRAYVAKRTAEGKTKREIIRCLKRYVTRQIYRTLNASEPTPAASPNQYTPAS